MGVATDMHASISYSADVIHNQAENDISSICEARGCQAKPTKKISLTVDEGIIILQVCEQCVSKFVGGSNIAVLPTCFKDVEHTVERETRKLSVSPRARGASAADSLGNGKMQLIKDFDVSMPLRREMATKQKELPRLEGWSPVEPSGSTHNRLGRW